MLQRSSIILGLLLLAVQSGFIQAQTPVSVAEVSSKRLPNQLQLSGNIVAVRDVDLSTEVAGQVAEVLIEQGDQVVAGQALMKLRDAPAQWRLAEARAQLQRDQAAIKLAELEETRLKRLLNSKSISIENYDQALASLQQASAGAQARKAEIARLEDNLNRHTITAPFDGVITSKQVELGKWVNVGDTVVHLASLQQLRLELAIPQRYFQALRQAYDNATVTVTTDAHAQQLSAKLTRLVPVADNARSFRVWVAIDNQQKHWIPGMSASAKLAWQPTAADLVVPTDALVRRADGRIEVWKLTQNASGDDNGEGYQATPVTVQVTGSINDVSSIVSDALQQGDQVIVRGNETLQPGQSISPVNLRR